LWRRDMLKALRAQLSPGGGGKILQLLLLATGIWAVSYARVLLGPLQEALRLDLKLSDNEVALLQGPAIAIPLAVGSIPIGLLVDRYKRVPLFLFFVTLGIASACATAFATTFAMVFAARFLAGCAVAAVLIAGYSAVGDLYAPSQRGRATMVAQIGENLSSPAAFAIGGVLLAANWSIAGLSGWRAATLLMAAPLVPALLLMLFLREPARTAIEVKNPPLLKAWPELWRYRGVVFPLLIARMTIWLADGAVLVWGVPTFSRGFGLSPAVIGAMMATALLVSCTLGPFLGGFLTDWCQRTGGPRRSMQLLSLIALLCIPAALFPLMPDYRLSAILLTLFLVFGFMSGMMALAVATIVVPGELRGLLIALTITVGATFLIGLAPLAVSGLSGLLGGEVMIGRALAIVCAVSSLGATIVFGFGSRFYPGKDIE
jgi:MFS family permease